MSPVDETRAEGTLPRNGKGHRMWNVAPSEGSPRHQSSCPVGTYPSHRRHTICLSSESVCRVGVLLVGSDRSGGSEDVPYRDPNPSSAREFSAPTREPIPPTLFHGRGRDDFSLLLTEGRFDDSPPPPPFFMYLLDGSPPQPLYTYLLGGRRTSGTCLVRA